jgi:hypothetical protein
LNDAETLPLKSVDEILSMSGFKGPTLRHITVAGYRLPISIFKGTKNGSTYYLARNEKLGLASTGLTQKGAADNLKAQVEEHLLARLTEKDVEAPVEEFE